jgi:membrane associated rhomboid family serine protease
MICYRHPGREAYVRCQRCEQIICPECQVEASVGFLCPDCAGGTPDQLAAKRRKQQRWAAGKGQSAVTSTLIGVNVFVFLAQLLLGWSFTANFAFNSSLFWLEPWRAITSGFLHSPDNPLHLVLNMVSLFVFGRVLEPMLGRVRFIALYLLSTFGASVAVVWFSGVDKWTLGASGAIFGLMGAYFVILRKLGGGDQQILVVIAINLGFGFIVPGVSWQAHIGGLIAGALVAWVLAGNKFFKQKTQAYLGLLAVFTLLVLLAYIGLEANVFPQLMF